MSSREAIAMVESIIGDARRGLPEEVFLFISRNTPIINVDLLIQDDGRTLLTWRDDEFFGSGWHVPGGVIRYKETAADRIRACGREELAADISFDSAPLFVSETICDQSNRGHSISLLFRCRLVTPLDEAKRARSDFPSSGEWRWHDVPPPNLLDVQRQYLRFL